MEKGRYLPWSKEEEGTYIFEWNKCLCEGYIHWNGYSHLEFEWVLSENEKDHEIDFGSVERENDLEFINYWRRNIASY
jgi:hypothetical protein